MLSAGGWVRSAASVTDSGSSSVPRTNCLPERTAASAPVEAAARATAIPFVVRACSDSQAAKSCLARFPRGSCYRSRRPTIPTRKDDSAPPLGG